MITTQEIFNKTLDEIDNRLKKADEYEILMTSALLRKLLLDGKNSLIYQVNKNNQGPFFLVNVRQPLHKRVPSVFTENDLSTYSWLAGDGLNPDTANKNNYFNPQKLTIEQFLQQVVIYTHGNEITVKELIRHMALKEGAVHKQSREFSDKEAKNLLIKELSEFITIGNLPAGLSTLRTICIIVVRDLTSFKKYPTS